ncbi:MAG: Mur ligase family protein [Pseudomonadota bacterium]
MTDRKRYFFCGIGGSGMLPLAMILSARGAEVSGSDRALDQGHTPEKFGWLRAQGVGLFAQDGSGLNSKDQVLVASAAVEETVADVKAARALGCVRRTRAHVLAELFNEAPMSVGVAGTSGKSTTTAMLSWILDQAGYGPTVMNGAVMKNFVSAETPFASALAGSPTGPFVSEIDESDGSIDLFSPQVAVLTNVSVDHKSMDELRALFGAYLGRANAAVVNADDVETASLSGAGSAQFDFSLRQGQAFLSAGPMSPAPFSIAFEAHWQDQSVDVRLPVPGRHNVANALAAMCAAHAIGIPIANSADALASFKGLKRRFEYVGEAAGVTVIDDFAHNPDKIAATLSTLRDAPGRLLVLFQPHGFGPLRKMRHELAASFAAHLTSDDRIWMPEPVYYGGTVDRSVSSADLVGDLQKAGIIAAALPKREACGEALLTEARPGDRIVIMGARDDTLSIFAESLVSRLAG